MKAKFSVFGVCTGTLLPIAFACGGDDGIPDYVHTTYPDAAIDAMEPCLGQPTYAPGALGSDVTDTTDYPAAGSGSDATPHEIYFMGNLDNNDPGDVLYMDLYAGFGGFGSDIAPGSYPLTDDDAAYSTCGACVYIGAQVDSAGNVGNYYFARGGTLTLTDVTGHLTGTLNNVSFYRVKKDVDGNPSDDATFDCESHMMNATFDSPITIDTGSGSAAPAPHVSKKLTRRWAN